MFGISSWRKNFIILWSGQGISVLTSSIAQMAIIWYLTDKTSSAAILSIAALVGFLPQAILGTFIGVLIDRYNRKLIMIIADIVIAILSLVLVVAGYYGEISILIIMIVLFLRSIATAFHYPSLQAITPLIVPKENITKYSGYSQGFETISLVISPAIAAMLYGIWDLNMIILIEVFGAIFATITLLFTYVPKVNREVKNKISNIILEAKQGFFAIKNVDGLLGIMLIGALYAIIYFPIGTLYPLITMSYFGGGFTESGFVETCFAIGMFVGSIGLGIIGNKLSRFFAIILSITTYGLGLIITGFLLPSAFIVFVIISFFMGITVPFFTGIEVSIFQIKIKEEYLGRAMSLYSSLTMLVMPIGLVLSGLFAEYIGIEKWFLISGFATISLAILCFLIPSIKKCCQ